MLRLALDIVSSVWVLLGCVCSRCGWRRLSSTFYLCRSLCCCRTLLSKSKLLLVLDLLPNCKVDEVWSEQLSSLLETLVHAVFKQSISASKQWNDWPILPVSFIGVAVQRCLILGPTYDLYVVYWLCITGRLWCDRPATNNFSEQPSASSLRPRDSIAQDLPFMACWPRVLSRKGLLWCSLWTDAPQLEKRLAEHKVSVVIRLIQGCPSPQNLDCC